MIEIFSILTQLFIITIFCYVPTNICLFLKSNKNPDILNRLEIGIILNLFVLLILSFSLRSGSNTIYFVLIIIFLNNLLFLSKDIFQKYKGQNLKIDYIFLFFISAARSSHIFIDAIFDMV